jgi:hypothetical protein
MQLINSGSKALSRQTFIPSLEAPLDTNEKDQNIFIFFLGIEYAGIISDSRKLSIISFRSVFLSRHSTTIWWLPCN